MYQELYGEMTTEGTVPDADESKQFWSEIWGKDVEHEQNAECIWLKELNGKRTEIVQPEWWQQKSRKS